MNINGSMQRWISSALLCGAAAAGCCRADTIFLTDGREINGTIVNEDQQTVVIKTTRGTNRSVRRAEIDTIVREKAKVAGKEVKDEPKQPGVPTPAPPPASVSTAPGAKPVVPGPNASPSAPNTAAPPLTNVAPTTPPPRVPGPPTPITPITPALPDAAASTPPPKAPPVGPTATAVRPPAPSGPLPISGFPENTKRMSPRKEALLADALETIKVGSKNLEDTTREPALADIRALGSDVVPYLWAGIQNDDAEIRTACMKLIGQMNGRTCTKRVLETFYMTMPESSAAAIWNVPFVDETMKTMITITGQTFITVEARRLGVQDGLKKYIDWYKANFRILPRQVGEPDLDPNDAGFDAKLAAVRELKLTKREWPRAGGNLPVDVISGPNKTAPEKNQPGVITDAERPVDKRFGDSIPTVPEGNALKRPSDRPGAPEDDEALKRPIDRRVNQVPSAPQNQRRDAPTEIPSQKPELPDDPLLRPQDRQRLKQQQQ